MRSWRKANPRKTVAGGVVLGLLLLYMLVGGAVAAHLIAGRATERLGQPVTIGSGRGGLGTIVLSLGFLGLFPVGVVLRRQPAPDLALRRVLRGWELPGVLVREGGDHAQ